MKYCTLMRRIVNDAVCYECKYPEGIPFDDEVKQDIAWNEVANCIFRKRKHERR